MLIVWLHSIVAAACLSCSAVTSLTPQWSHGGHSAMVTSVSVSPVGGLAASASMDSLLNLWALPSLQLVHCYSFDGAPLLDIDFAADGASIAVSSGAGQVTVVNATDGAVIFSAPAADPCVRALDMHPLSPTLLLVGECSGRIRTYDVATGLVVSSWAAHSGEIRDIKWTPDALHIVSATATGEIKLWTSTGSLVRTISAGVSSINCVAITNHPGLVFAGFGATAIKSWSTDTGAIATQYAGHVGGTTSLELVSGFAKLVSGGADGNVRRWNVASGAQEVDIAAQGGGVSSSALSVNSRRVVVGGIVPKIRLYDIDTGSLIADPCVHQKPVLSTQWSSDGTKVLTASGDGSAVVLDGSTGALIVALKMPVPSAPTPSLTFAPEVATMNPVSAARFHPTSTDVVTGSFDGVIRVWNGSTGALIRSVAAHTDCILGLACSTDGTFMVTVAQDGTMQVRTYADGAIRKTVTFAGQVPAQVVIDPANAFAFAVIDNAGVSRVRLSDGVVQWTHPFAGVSVIPIIVSQDGGALFVGANDGTVHKLDSATGAEVAAIDCGPEPVVGLSMVDAGSFAVATQDRRVTYRSAASGAVIYVDDANTQGGVISLSAWAASRRVCYGHRDGGVTVVAYDW